LEKQAKLQAKADVDMKSGKKFKILVEGGEIYL